MKDFGTSDNHPDREDPDGRQEGQPAYKAFTKDKRVRITTSRPTGKTDYHRPEERSDNKGYPGEGKRDVHYGQKDDPGRDEGRRNYGNKSSDRGGESGNYQHRDKTSYNRNAETADYRNRERKPYDGNKERTAYGNNDRYSYNRGGDNRSDSNNDKPSYGRKYGNAAEGGDVRRSYNPNFDASNRPVNRERNSGDANHGGSYPAGRDEGYRRRQEGDGGHNTYGVKKDYIRRQDDYPGRQGGGQDNSSGYPGGRQYERKPSYDRYGKNEGENSYAGGDKRSYGNRSDGRTGYDSRKTGFDKPSRYGYGKQGDKYQSGRQGDNKKGYGAPKYNSENYPTFPAPVIEDKIRLNRYIAMSGICSRREADEFIQSGVVTVNGLVVTELGAKVSKDDEVRFNGNLIKNEQKVYIVMNKPKGYVTSVEDPHADKTVMELLKNGCRERVYPVGRLDKNSLGVLLITNDGDMAKKLMHPSFEKKKVYQVSLDKPLTRADLDSLVQGFELDDGEIHADAVSYVADKKTEIGVEIHSGRNRIVRRMFEHLGYKVTKLDRVYFAGLTKQRLRRGEWRFLTPREVQALRSGQYE